MLENGLSMYLWIGANVDPNHIQNLFGVSHMEQLNVEKVRNELRYFMLNFDAF